MNSADQQQVAGGNLEAFLGWEQAVAQGTVQPLEAACEDHGIQLIITGMLAHPERTLLAYHTDAAHSGHLAIEAVMTRDDGTSSWLQGIHYPHGPGNRFLEFEPIPPGCTGIRVTVYRWTRTEEAPLLPRPEQVAFPAGLSEATRRETYMEILGEAPEQSFSSGEVSRGGSTIWRPGQLSDQALRKWDQWLVEGLGESYDPIKGATGNWTVDLPVDVERRHRHFYWVDLNCEMDLLGRRLRFTDLCGDSEGAVLSGILAAPARRQRLEEILSGTHHKEGEAKLRAWYHQGAVGPYLPAMRLAGPDPGFEPREVGFVPGFDHYRFRCPLPLAGRPSGLEVEILGPLRLPALELQALEMQARERRFPLYLKFAEPGCQGDIRLESMVVGRGPVTLSYRVNAQGNEGVLFKGLGLGLCDDRGRVYLAVDKGDFAPIEVETVSGKCYTVTFEPATELPGLLWRPPGMLRLDLEWMHTEPDRSFAARLF